MLDFAKSRRTMVDCQIRTFDVTDRAVLAAFEEVPRERFMPAGREALAYSDGNVALSAKDGSPRCMLQPMVLARMIQALGIRSGAKVLDVASGLGYSSAILARLGAAVSALEPDADLAAKSRETLASLGAGSATVRAGALDGDAPGGDSYDAILVNGAVEIRPDALLERLGEGGRLACLKTDGGASHALLYVRGGEGIGSRLLFDAAAPVLAEFRRAASFVF